MVAPLHGPGVAPGLRVQAVARTHEGRRRSNNEDYVLIRADLGIYVVADGVGGHNTGEVASKLAALSIVNFFEATDRQSWPDSYRDSTDLTLQPDAQRLSAAVRKANADVHCIATTREAHDNMNTTVVAVYSPVGGTTLHLAHVGDSRCYRRRGRHFDLLTHDHTLRNEAIKQYPDITAEHLAQIPKNMLSRALGRQDTVEIDVRSLELLPSDLFLVCSDGLSRMLDDDVIFDIVATADPAQLDATADALVTMANEAGGRDNITVLLLSIGEHAGGRSARASGG